MLVLTDLDTADCAPTLRSDWLAQRAPHPFLLLRVAVREVEAWALADHEALRQLMGTKGKLPPTPDELPDPKQTLLTLAKLAPKRIRDDLLRVDPHGQLRQGIGYNAQLSRWVQHTWNPSRAAARSPSLQRTLKRLHDTGHAFATGHHHVP